MRIDFSEPWTSVEVRLLGDDASKTVSLTPKQYLRVVKDHAMASKARREAREAYAARVGKETKAHSRDSDADPAALV